MHPAKRITATALSAASTQMFFIRLKSRVIGNKSCDFDPLLVEYLREGKSLDRPTVVQPLAAAQKSQASLCRLCTSPAAVLQ
jgi:hypothetical protein